MLDPARSRLYVAGTNVLYQLDDALRVSHKVETGPVLDSHECSATECSNGPTTKVDTDNHAKVLVLDARSDRLLLCGSVRQGACYRHSPTDFTVNTEQLLTAVAAKTEAASTFGFIGPQQYNPWNSDDVLYVGTTFTQHGDYRQGVPAISSRNLDNLQFAEFSFSRQSLLRIDVKYRDLCARVQLLEPRVLRDSAEEVVSARGGRSRICHQNLQNLHH